MKQAPLFCSVTGQSHFLPLVVRPYEDLRSWRWGDPERQFVSSDFVTAVKPTKPLFRVSGIEVTTVRPLA